MPWTHFCARGAQGLSVTVTWLPSTAARQGFALHPLLRAGRAEVVWHCHLASFYRRSATGLAARGFGAVNAAWLPADESNPAAVFCQMCFIQNLPAHCAGKKYHDDIENRKARQQALSERRPTCMSPTCPARSQRAVRGQGTLSLARAARPSAERRYLRSQQSFPRRLPRPMGAVWGAGALPLLLNGWCQRRSRRR